MPPEERIANPQIVSGDERHATKTYDAALWWSVATSVFLHIAFLMVLGYFSANRPALIDSPRDVFELVLVQAEPPVPLEPEVEVPAPEPEPAPIPEQVDAEAEPPAETTSTDPIPVIADAAEPDDQDEDTSATNTALRVNADLIRAQIRERLDANITLPDNTEPASGIVSSEPVDVPGMPTAAGWLNNYVGTVEASLQRWGDPGGAINARMVLPSGHVVCIQGAAPAHGEIFHIGWPPIAMARICGRERPTPVDPTRLDTPPMIRARHLQD